MPLPPIDTGPIPTEQDLAPYLEGGRPISDVRDVVETFARMDWEAALKERDPDAFLVPFSTSAFPALGFRSYQSYLASPLWRAIRNDELRKAGGLCAACGHRTRTVHHRDYRPRVLRGEDRAALIALCQRCHDKLHYDGRRRERSWNEGERILDEMISAHELDRVRDGGG